MKLREWILEGTAIGGDESRRIKLYTTPDAERKIAMRKLRYKIPENYRHFVKLVKGKTVEIL